MSPHEPKQPFIAVFGNAVHSGLARLILRRNWSFFRATSASGVIDQLVAIERQTLIVVQSDHQHSEVMLLLRFLRMPWRKAPAIVLDVAPAGHAESVFRSSGALMYLTADTSDSALEAAIDGCLLQPLPELAQQLQRDSRPVRDHRSTQPSRSDRKAV